MTIRAIINLLDNRSRPALSAAIVLWTLAAATARLDAEPPNFEVLFSSEVRPDPFTGRVYLLFTADPRKEPRRGPDWFRPEPFVGLDVVDWKPGESLTISFDDPQLKIFPKKLRGEEIRGFRVQAVARFNPWEREVGSGPGNGHSSVAQVPAQGKAELRIDRVNPGQPFNETRWTKEFRVPSRLLTEFCGRPVEVKGAVTVPESYLGGGDRRYPVIFEIPGFGGTHRMGIHRQPRPQRNNLGVEFIHVMLDPSCPLGHHVFADSANNGPWGSALVQEFLPAFDAAWRTVPHPEARFLTGHSSGGWSSLWIQLTHPETFGGVWSTAPDPVDFRDFQRIDLYQTMQNMYHAGDQRRPLARLNGRVALWYDDFDRMEDVLGPGGQLHSFEAVFSPRGKDGTPQRLWSRETGEVDSQVADAWQAYDIRLLVERNWETLGPKLSGKVRVSMGTEDTFYLEGATQLLKESFARLNSDAVVEMIPGRTHFDLFADGLSQRIEQWMAERFVRFREAGLPNPR